MTPSRIKKNKRTILIVAGSFLIAILLIGVAIAAVWQGGQSREGEKDPFSAYLEGLNEEAAVAITGPFWYSSFDLSFEGRANHYQLLELTELGAMRMGYSQEQNQRIKEENQATLQGFIGEFFLEDGGRKWYRVRGHEDLQYLICKFPQGELKGYEFQRYKLFNNDDIYSYGEVLSDIYHVISADDIRQIVFLPPRFDQTESGKATQKEISTVAVSKKSDIRKLTAILSDMRCYGEGSLGRDDLPCYREDTICAMKIAQMSNTSMYRVVRIDLKNGASVQTLKYSATWGGFYQNDGVAYHDLSDEDAELIHRLGRIRTN